MSHPATAHDFLEDLVDLGVDVARWAEVPLSPI
jgi:hypothetical protein